MVLATVGPSLRNFQESLSTLQFAARCKEIQLTPLSHASVTQDDEQVSALKEQIMDLQSEGERREAEYREGLRVRDEEIASLKARLREAEERESGLKRDHESKVKQLKL